MNSIVIEKIEFQNFRQYKSGKLSFPKRGEHMLSVLIAQNGTGKTTLLNAITWCLYNEEQHLSGSGEALTILNKDVLEHATPGRVYDVSVVLTITADGKTIEFKRVQSFRVDKDEHGINIPVQVNREELPEFTVSSMIQGGTENTVVKTGQDAEIVVKQYFDQKISKFYFFDGEKLGDFFEEERGEEIKTSIFNISQVNLLSDCIHHIETVRNETKRRISRDCPSLETLMSEQNKLKEEIENARINKKKADRGKRELDQKIQFYNKQIGKLRPVREKQNERNMLEDSIQGLLEEKDRLLVERARFIRRNLTLLNLYPSIKKVYNYISGNPDKFPPRFDIATLKRILKDSEANCPICNNHLTDESRRHIQEYIDKTPFSSESAAFIDKLSDVLADLIGEIEEFPEKKETLENNLQNNSSKIEANGNRLKEISRELKVTDYGEENLTNKINKLEHDRADAKSQFEAQAKISGAFENTIEILERKIEDKSREVEEATKRSNADRDTKKQLDLFEKLKSHIEAVKDNIMKEMKDEIERITWECFDSMIWKEKTFGDIQIGEDYKISVFDKENREMTRSLSATEQMALAYAYTLAIHEASGRNCPLVIDSPLGRVSDTNREKMAEELFKVSKEKQIIMLFTPDEYSDPVREIYEGNVLVRKLKLSEDENYVKGVEQNG